MSPATASPLTQADLPAVGRLLDTVVGDGFWSLGGADDAVSFVLVDEGLTVGVILACLTLASEALPAEAACEHAGVSGDARALHIRELAIAHGWRRGGGGSRLLALAEAAGRDRGASLALVYAWLPAGRPEPDSAAFYESRGFAAGADLPGSYSSWSVESGAVCPYCGPPPCRCDARVYLKRLSVPG